MDEFLDSIWNSNDNQINTQQPTHDESPQTQNKNIVTEPIVPQQGSFSVPPSISKKTVDEVSSEIHKSKPQQNYIKKQPTLGEITLEDFLIKAGVVQESSLPQIRTTMPFQNQICNASSNRQQLSVSYGLRSAMGTGPSTQCVPSNCLPNATYQMSSQCDNLGVQNCAVEKCKNLPESSGRKRIIDGPAEVVVERRQRRMLKNRESAARSRARRQAYTVELEAELNLLKEENDKLKQNLAEAERKRKQEICQRKHSTKTQKGTEKLRAIRRHKSATW